MAKTRTPPAVTPWFTHKSGVLPVRHGVYETQLLSAPGGYLIEQGFSHWDGERWSNNRPSVARAFSSRKEAGMQCKNWRGLTKEAK